LSLEHSIIIITKFISITKTHKKGERWVRREKDKGMIGWRKE